jgi:hypothetical protein
MAGSLEFIKSATVSSVSSVSVTDCFSDKYDVYKIIFHSFEKQTSADNLGLRLIDSGGSIISDSEYDRALLQLQPDQAFTEVRHTNQTSLFSVIYQSVNSVGAGSTIYLFNPYDSSSYTFYINQSNSFDGKMVGRKHIGVHKVAEQTSGFNFFVSNGTFSMDISVYGVK